MYMPQYSLPATVVGWTARLGTIALFVLFTAFLFGQEPAPKLLQEPLRVQLIFACWAIVFGGYLVGWKSPSIGGLLVLAAIGMMYLVEYLSSGRWLGPAFLLWLAPGILYLASAWMGYRKSS